MRNRTPIRARRALPGGDAGVTMIDLMVAMALMSIIGAIATGGLAQLYRMTDATDRMDEAQTQASLAYAGLQPEIGVAYDISDPGAGAGGDPSVEYVTQDSSGQRVCHQLRLSGGTLKLRQWPASATTVSAAGWRVLASGLAAPATPDADTGAAAAPQTLHFPDFSTPSLTNLPSATPLQLRIRLTATASGGKGSTQRDTQTTVVAANSTVGWHDPVACSLGRNTP
ncbi:hypothetical protein ACWT_4382 [Actinoplanes sp. SE50]|uniref:hypothetical protein n=1 Tax=unclassified Actinoplanes TaxID=2626549 RepID=UPI00023EC9B8|nr:MULTISPECIES: hypothetical protein [unclassified Actinoplanes]AEV85402.1 hypothetical protein ACPL_4511 [Actinoplanes sp. SE50/110]ATO83797.1 hypothetical protein ACWT_4382 [Actinoplanes sp. SE50]SLM01205.1 hypothetical protein ACSP50_4441 [Actinoplanes sp. SE50/110]